MTLQEKLALKLGETAAEVIIPEQSMLVEDHEPDFQPAANNNVIPLPRTNNLVPLDVVPAFAITLLEARERVQMLQEFVRDIMIPGQDYGYIPGCPKPSLLKPGAEKLCDIFGFSKQLKVTNRIEDWQNGVFAYEVIVTLISKLTGLIEAEGVGSCNSKEKKYRTQDSYSVANTVLKMAKKRALVDAVLSATRSSGLFTQDIEEIGITGFNSSPKQQSQSTYLHHGTNAGTSDIHPRQTAPNQPQPAATEKQLKKIYVLAWELKLPPETAKQMLLDLYHVKESTQLNKRQASDLISRLVAMNK